MNNIFMNIISAIFIVGLIIYTVSIYKKLSFEKNRLKNIGEDKICYLFVDAYINMIAINEATLVPLERSDYLKFKAIPKNSKCYIFEYTSIVKPKFHYIETHALKKNINTNEINAIYNIQPKHIYYLYGDDKNEDNITFNFKDITKEST
ncbi:MAG: hypothetical protein QMB51_00830 [Patescibacteria group bacterium]